MRMRLIIAATVACGLAGAALAQPVGQNPPRSTIICLDGGGHPLPATCRVPASRLDPTEDICICPALGQRIEAPICPAGVKPPADSAAYDRARLAAVKNGSVVGAVWQGQPMCEAGRLDRNR